MGRLASGRRPAIKRHCQIIHVMSDLRMRFNARASPRGDAQGQHPAPVRNGQGLPHLSGRGRRKKLVQKKRLRIGSWNIGTMTGRGTELADILQKRRINIACLQETKWKGSKARELGGGYKFYYCGKDGRKNGVGIVLDGDLKNNVVEVNRINDRIMVIKLLLGELVLHVMSVYAPQVGCDDNIKQNFWEDLDTTLMGIPSEDQLIIGGDFNGHVGKHNKYYERVHGDRGWGIRNFEGECLLQMATAFDLAVANTYFEKKVEHLVTYKSGQHASQIDFFLVRRGSIKEVKDCKVIPGEPLTGQHRLLVLECKVDLNKIKFKQKHVAKTKWWLLEKENFAEQFKTIVHSQLEKALNEQHITVNNSWVEIAEIIRKTAKTVLGEKKPVKKIDKETWWWNEEVQNAVKEKKAAFKSWQSENSMDLRTEKKNTYNRMKLNAKTSVAIARARIQDELYESLGRPEGQKALFRLARRRGENSRDMIKIRCMKDENGRVLLKDDDIKERWKNYFDQLLNVENERDRLPETIGKNMGMVENIEEWEVELALRKMHKGKAVGPDNIPIEVWKLLGGVGTKWLSCLFNAIFSEEIIPEEWKNSHLVPIFKEKGDIQDCGNYRGIKLMSHTFKLWEKVIERRLRAGTEISDNQFGFMPGRGTTDAIFAIRQLMEKYRAVQRNLHMVFIDLEKAYDRVPRDLIWRCLENLNVPFKYIRLIQAMYEGASAQVRTAVGTTKRIHVKVGLHQGSALSPYLFLLVMEAITSAIQEDAPWCMLFADDIVLVDECGAKVQEKLNQWQIALESVGLKMSRSKTEYMFCDFSGPTMGEPVSLNGKLLPVCTEFRYLGSLLQSDGNIDRDITRRMNAGWMKWKQLTGTTCDSRMPIKTKGKIYKTAIRPVLLYGAECWPTKVYDCDRMHVTEMRMLRWMCGVTRNDRIRNEYIRGSMKVAPITEKIKSHRLSWFGHVMRREESHVTKKALHLRPEGRRKRGRPKKEWYDCVKDDMRECGVNVDLTGDRMKWRDMTHKADPT